MKSNSKAAQTTPSDLIEPCSTTSASALAGRSLRLFQPFRILARILELQAVHRQHLGADLEAPFRIEQPVQARARADALVVAALRADIQVLFQVSAVEHRAAGRALGPQALGHLLARPGAALDLGRQQFLQPAHESRALRIAGSAPSRAPPRARRPALSISCTMRVPMITASAIFAIRKRRRRILDAKADADRQLGGGAQPRKWVAMSAASAVFTPVTPLSDT
jgi:hypothetical protein